MLSLMESTGMSRDHYEEDAVFGVEVYYGQSGTGAMRLKLLFLVISVCNFASFILHLHRFDFKRPKRTTSFPGCVCVCVCVSIYIYIYIKRGRVSAGFVWVDPPGRSGFAGSTPRRVLLRPGPVPGLGRPGRPAGPVQVSKLWQEHTTHLNEKYKRLSTDYKELVHPFISPMVLGMTNLLFPLQRRLCFSFIIFEQINLQ